MAIIKIVTEADEAIYIPEFYLDKCVLVEPTVLNKNPQAKSVIFVPGIAMPQPLSKHEFERIKFLIGEQNEMGVKEQETKN